MKTPYLNEEIERLESFKNPITEHVEQLKEFKAIKEALSIHDVSGFFTADDMEEAYNDGAGINTPREFNINNYR